MNERGKTGLTGKRGVQGIRGQQGQKGDTTFVSVTNQDVYLEIKTLQDIVQENRFLNEEEHAKIIIELTALRVDTIKLIDELKNKNEIAHEKMKGNINLVKATMLSAMVMAGYAIIWLWQHITS